jgi:hypothetical protein
VQAIRELPQQEPRVETGPVQFGDDWPGTFIRGDDAAYFAFILGKALDEKRIPKNDPIILGVLVGLKNVLADCVIGSAREML